MIRPVVVARRPVAVAVWRADVAVSGSVVVGAVWWFGTFVVEMVAHAAARSECHAPVRASRLCHEPPW